MKKQIICQDLKIGYEKIAVQKNINLSIDENDFVNILGENGSGKSTFIKTLLTLISPISGKIHLENGIKVRDFAYVAQQTQRQKDFPASVWEVALSGHISKHALRPFYTKQEKKDTLLLLEKIGIAHLKNLSYSKISVGQQQRVLLARALCAKAKIVFLDEPSSALDPEAKLEMYELLEQLNKEGLTIVMITHDVHTAVNYANKIIVFGRDVLCMDKAQYLAIKCSCASSE